MSTRTERYSGPGCLAAKGLSADGGAGAAGDGGQTGVGGQVCGGGERGAGADGGEDLGGGPEADAGHRAQKRGKRVGLQAGLEFLGRLGSLGPDVSRLGGDFGDDPSELGGGRDGPGLPGQSGDDLCAGSWQAEAIRARR